MTIKDYITAPVAERRREDWILAQLGLNPDDVERVVLDRNLVCRLVCGFGFVGG